jgi:hypothetical protein
MRRNQLRKAASVRRIFHRGFSWIKLLLMQRRLSPQLAQRRNRARHRPQADSWEKIIIHFKRL